MTQQSTSKVQVEAEAGKFTLVVKSLKNTKLNKQSALRLFHGASKACRLLEAECDDGIEELCKLLVGYLDSLEEADVTNYLSSLYFIVKLICNRERFEDVPRMKAILLPKFISHGAFKGGPQFAQVYKFITNLISESIYQVAQEKSTVFDSCRLKTFEILLQIRKTFNNLKDLMDFADKWYIILRACKPSNDQVLVFYNSLLQVVSSKFGHIQEYSSSIQVRLAPITSSILSDAVKNEQFSFAEQFLDSVESALGQEGFQIFRAVSSLFPLSDMEMKTRVNKARLMINEFKSRDKKLFYNLVYFLELPIHSLLLFYEKTGRNDWSETCLLDVSQFIINDILCHSSIYLKECNCGCSITKNYRGILDISCTLTLLWRSYLTKIKNPSNELVEHMTKTFQLLFQVVKKLKEAECEKWHNFFYHLSANNWNTIVKLLNSQIDSVEKLVIYFLTNVFDLDGIQPQVMKLSVYTGAFTAVCQQQIQEKHFLSAMGLSALYCLLYPETRKALFDRFWIMSKAENKANVDIRKQTLVGILHAQKKKLSHIVDFTSLLTKSKEVDLLEFELLRYRAHWQSKFAMLATLSHIIEIASASKLADIFVSVYGDGQVPVHIDCLPVFTTLEESFKTSLDLDPSSCTLQLALAAVQFYLFKLSCMKTVEKNRLEMEKRKQVNESLRKQKVVEMIPKDKDDECDIVSAYSDLQLSKFMEVLQLLNTSLRIIRELNPTGLKPKEIANAAHLLTIIGFNYRLHGDSVKSLNAFHLSLKYSSNIENPDLCLFAISFLIESANVAEDYVKELIQKGDELAKDKASEGCSKTLATYYLCKSKAYLFDNPDRSYEAWKEADKICSANANEMGFPMLRAQLHVILHKLTRNCNFIRGHHDEAPMAFHLHAAHDIVIDCLQKNVLAPYEQDVLLDTIFELAKIYSLMRLPRDSRSYAKNAVLYAQKVVLPIKCISFLILLAHCDLATGNIDHYNVKLIGVDDILSVSQFKSSTQLFAECHAGGQEEKVPDDVDQCSSLMGTLGLDAPRFTRQCPPSSPPLRVDSFKLPKFVSHVPGCLCFMCQSLVCQDLLLKRFHLISVANMYQQEEQLVEEYAVGSLKLYKKLARKFSSFKSEISKLFPASLIPDFKDMFSECYFNVLYTYNVQMCRTSRQLEALKLNNRLIQMLEPKKTQYVHLYHDAQLLTINCLPAVEGPATEPLRRMGATVEATSSAPIMLTPANKVAPITLQVNGIELNSPPKKPRIKCNLFDAKAQSTPSNATNIRVLPVRKIKKAATGKPLTATETINIFTDDSPGVSSTTRKRVAKKPAIDPAKESVESKQSQRRLKTRSQTKGLAKTEEACSEKPVEDHVPASRKTGKNKPLHENADDSSVIPSSPERACAKNKERLMQKLKSSAKKSSSCSSNTRN